MSTIPARRASALRGPLPILIASVLWGTTGTASSLVPAAIPRPAIGCAGMLLGGLLLFGTAARPGWRLLTTTGHRWRLPLGMIAVIGYPLSFYPAVADTGVAVATVVALGSAPVFTGLLTWATTGLRPTTRWLAATAVAIAGCATLVLGGGHTGISPLGVLLAGVAGLSYAVYSIIGGQLISAGEQPRAVMGVLFGGAALLAVPVVLASAKPLVTSVPAMLVAAHLAVFTIFTAYLLYGHGLRHTTATTATTLTLTEPAVAALLGITVLGERLTAISWLGLAVLALALIALSIPTRGPKPRPA